MTIQEARAELKQIHDILAMAETQQQLIEKIERLQEPYSTVLSKRYIHLERFEKIAVDMNYSFRSVKEFCKRGLKKYSEL